MSDSISELLESLFRDDEGDGVLLRREHGFWVVSQRYSHLCGVSADLETAVMAYVERVAHAKAVEVHTAQLAERYREERRKAETAPAEEAAE